ncbi:ZP domain-containing protein-like isoform X2 [Oculina patagonica]
MIYWILAVVMILSPLALTVVGNEPGITCGDYVMIVSFEKNRFPSLNASRLHLLNPSCLATETSTHLYVNTSLNGCGTSFVETGDVLVFSNVVRQDASPQQSSANDGSVLITREHDFKLPFHCSYSRKKLLSLYFVSVGRIDIPGAEGLGNITFKFDVYRSPSYATPYTDEEYPVEVILNDYTYFEYSVESDAQDLVIMAENCRTTKGEIFYSTPYSTVIENGCPRDTTLVYDYNDTRSYQRFKLRARWFFNDHDTFYMHCELLACHVNSNSSDRYQCCNFHNGHSTFYHHDWCNGLLPAGENLKGTANSTTRHAKVPDVYSTVKAIK